VSFVGLDAPVRAVFIRAPWVERVGDQVDVLARIDGGQPDASVGRGAGGRIVGVRQGALMATSFHPEVAGDSRVHQQFVSIVRDH
jgi:pyridoxal 5'-phosphate synthase pdxT subunit